MLAAALRLYGLEVQSLWNDELATLRGASQPSLFAALAVLARDHLPAYTVLMHVWMWATDGAAAASERMLRLPSALCGIATVPALFALGRRWYGPAEGLLAAGFAAVAWMPVFYSQEARPYALLLLGAVLSTLWLTDVVRAVGDGGSPPRGALVGFYVAATLTAYTHYFGVLFVALQASFAGVVLAGRGRLRAALTLLLPLVLACLPIAYVLLRHARPPGWIPPATPARVWELFVGVLNRSPELAGLVLALWAGQAARAVLRRTAIAPATWLLVGWAVMPVAIAYVHSLFGSSVFLERPLIIIVPAVYLLTARAVIQLPLPPPAVAAAAVALVGVLLIQLVVGQAYFTRPVKEQWREAAAWMVARDDPTTSALVVACAWRPFGFDYYLARHGSPRRVDRLVETAADAEAVRALAAARGVTDVWVLAGHKRPEPALLDALATELTLVDSVALRRTAVWHFRVAAADAAAPGA